MTQPSYTPAWVQPTFSPVYIPDLPTIGLSEDERALISRLQMQAFLQRGPMLLTEAYYLGEQVMTNLGIALPPELSALRAVLGWPAMAVDPYAERLAVDCFRRGGELSADETLGDLWLANAMAAEESIAFTDALIFRNVWWAVTRRETDEPNADLPRMCAESPVNVAATWDVRTRKPKAVLQSYWENDRRRAVLYTPAQNVFIGEDDNGVWQLVGRDQHNFGMVSMIRMVNRPRTANRDGSSEIRTALMSIVDAACRAVVNLDVASEFYSVPQKLILGATEEDFIGSDGQKKSAWETYIGRVLALQRDSEGALPEVKQFDAYDPSVFTKVIEMYAGQAAGIIAALPQDMGLYTDGNPVAPEALQTAEARRDRRAKRMQADFGRGMVELAQMAMRYVNDGDLPSDYERIAVDWTDSQMVNFTGYADGLSKLAQEGMIARGSDVALKKLGFNEVQRRQIKAELDASPAEQIVNELGTSVEGKGIRMANALIAAARPDTTTSTPDAPAKPSQGA